MQGTFHAKFPDIPQPRVGTTAWINLPSASDSEDMLGVLSNCFSVDYMCMVCLHMNFKCISEI